MEVEGAEGRGMRGMGGRGKGGGGRRRKGGGEGEGAIDANSRAGSTCSHNLIVMYVQLRKARHI